MARKRSRKAAPAAFTRQRQTAARGPRSNAPTTENQDREGSTPAPLRRSSRIRQIVQARQQATSKDDSSSRTLPSPKQYLPPKGTTSRKIRPAGDPQRGEPSAKPPSPPPRTRSSSADARPTTAQQRNSPLRSSASRSSQREQTPEAGQQEPTQSVVATRTSLRPDDQEVGRVPTEQNSASSPNAATQNLQPTLPSATRLGNLVRASQPADPIFANLLSAYPVTQSLLYNLNEWDRLSLISTLPHCRATLNASNMRVWSYCQDRPEHPNLMMAHDTNPNRFLQSFNHLQYERCETLDDAPLRHQNCRGHELGYAADIPAHSRHGPIFWVCDACARRAWEQHTILFKPPCVDLCLGCSQAHRNTFGDRGANQCTCLWDQSADKVHLCTECRKIKARRDNRTLMDNMRNRTQLQPMHAGTNGAHEIRDYIQEDSDRGASSCVCGTPVAQKVAGHLARAMRISHTTFDQFVRLCVWCHRPRFLSRNPYL